MSIVPYDGTEILLKTTTGIVSAWFSKSEIIDDYFGIDGKDYTGDWRICYDDKFQIEVGWDKSSDEPYASSCAIAWMPIP